MSKTIAKLEQLLGYQFKDSDLLERALTHRSWAYEKIPVGTEEEIRALQNESLEFVGDAVLGMAVVEYLFNKYPNASEGELTLMKHRLVSTETLAKNSQKLNLGDFLKVGRGEEKTGGRRKQALLADTMEAIIAAVFFDTGYISARNFVHKILADDFREITPTSSLDYKTLLQETLQAQKHAAPTYNVIKIEGPPHKRVFSVEAIWNGDRVEAQGSSIKSAEMAAANLALQKLNSAGNVKK
ncbi:MAG: ribonuclease III [Pyrinomonadaceae bacterium]|nr:ribonuclease III [Pyrinomonadaceae bacterium]